ncbi:MAG: metal ABC transporter permease [Kiritimatiellia bacterium]|jgi:zinc transport system permease protein
MTAIPDILVLPLVASGLAAVAAGAVGALTRVRRSTYVAAAVSHSVLAGLGLAQYLSVVHGVKGFTPMLGALLAAVAAALYIAFAQSRGARRTDSALGATWVVGMAIGLVFIHATPGYQGDLMNFLFGSVLLVSRGDIVAMALLDAGIIAALVVFWRGIVSICFDSQLAAVRGVRTAFFETVFSLITAIAVVVLVKVVGIVLAIALLTLPAMAAGRLVRRLVPMMVAGGAVAFAAMACGLAASWHADIPPSAPAVLFAALFAAATAAATCAPRGMRRQGSERGGRQRPK